MARHILERLTETPLTASTYSQRSLRVANGRSSFRSSLCEELAGRLTHLGWFARSLAGLKGLTPSGLLGGVTLEGGDPDPEGASSLGFGIPRSRALTILRRRSSE